MADKAFIKLGEKEVELPIYVGTEGEESIDINKLRDLTGFVTLDSGYKNTGATKSGITFLDGELGILRYRGYPIEQLAEKSNFMEVAYLLLYGELPTNDQFVDFTDRITHHTLVHEDVKQFFVKCASNGPIMLTHVHTELILSGFLKSKHEQRGYRFNYYSHFGENGNCCFLDS